MIRNIEQPYIGIAGPKRSGKDTLAVPLAALFGLELDSFAAPIRRFVAELAGLGPDLTALEFHKETRIPWLDGATPRHMMQTLGTEWGRQLVHPDLWVRSLFARLPAGGVVPDVRFPNEAIAIRERGGVVIQLQREGFGRGDAHASEQPLPEELVDVVLHNAGTPADLLRSAVAALRAVGWCPQLAVARSLV